jgi:hypothetical protein
MHTRGEVEPEGGSARVLRVPLDDSVLATCTSTRGRSYILLKASLYELGMNTGVSALYSPVKSHYLWLISGRRANGPPWLWCAAHGHGPR